MNSYINMKKIAFLFLIYDEINHEDIWRHFFQNVPEDKYNIYIHYKSAKPLKYFEKYKIKNCVETTYGTTTIMKAFNALLRHALEDTDNEHFILLSGSCIPFKSFDYIYQNLDANYSYFNIAPHAACFPRCNNALNYLEKGFIQKASVWCILNKKHSNIMLQEEENYMKWFDGCDNSDEHCYITTIFHNNLQNEIITTPNIAKDATTFVNWQGMDYRYPSYFGLKNYSIISKEELVYLLQSKSLFGRKFNKDCRSLYMKEYLDIIGV